jgi:hypothetical protein
MLEADLKAILKFLKTGVHTSTLPHTQDPVIKKSKRFLTLNG